MSGLFGKLDLRTDERLRLIGVLQGTRKAIEQGLKKIHLNPMVLDVEAIERTLQDEHGFGKCGSCHEWKRDVGYDDIMQKIVCGDCDEPFKF